MPLKQPALFGLAAAADGPAAATAPQGALRSHQEAHDHQGHQGQSDSGLGIPLLLPAHEDPGGEGRDPEQLHRSQLVHHLHARERHPGSNRGQGHGQGHAPKTAPGADSEAAAGL